MDRLARTTEILADLIGFPTVSADSNLDMIAHVAGLLEDAGARVEVLTAPCGTKANLFATVGPNVEGGVVLSGHTDVVPVDGQPWDSDPFTVTEKGDRLYGRGTADMKSFLAAALALVPEALAAGLEVPLHLAFSYDEEVGCLGVGGLIDVAGAGGMDDADGPRLHLRQRDRLGRGHHAAVDDGLDQAVRARVVRGHVGHRQPGHALRCGQPRRALGEALPAAGQHPVDRKLVQHGGAHSPKRPWMRATAESAFRTVVSTTSGSGP